MATGSTAAGGPGRWAGGGIAALVLAVVFYRAAPTQADPDLWGHVRFGLDMVETGRLVPLQEPYSYLTAGHDWLDDEWLAEIVFALVYRAAGPTGLILLKVAAGLAVAAALYAWLCRHGFDALWGGFVLLPASYLMLLALTGVRVMLFTHILFAGLLFLLVAAERDRRWLAALPPLFALWINLHPGVLAGLACTGVWVLAHLALAVWQDRRVAWPHLLAGVGAALALLVNPYGIRLPPHLWHAGVGARPELTEYAAIRVTSMEGVVYLLLLAACAAAWVRTRQPRSLPLLAVFACTAAAPLLAMRHAPLFAEAALVLTAPHLADLWQQWRRPGTDAPPGPAVGLGALAVGGVLAALAVPHLGCIRLDPAAYPIAAVDLLEASGVSGRLVVLFDWGEYVIWRAGPRVQVSIDPRRESAYPDDVYRRNFQFLAGVGDWDALLAAGPADLVLYSRDTAAYNLMRTRADWVLVHEDAVAALFVRRDAPQLPELQRAKSRGTTTSPAAAACFR